jgi:hypothetical protein
MSLGKLVTLVPLLGDGNPYVDYLDSLYADGLLFPYYIADIASRATATGEFSGAELLEASGSDAALNMDLTSITWGAEGGLVFNGTTSLGTIPNHTAIADLTTWGFFMDYTPTSLGEADGGRFYEYGAGGNAHQFAHVTGNALDGFVRTDAVEGRAISNAGQVTYIGSRALAFMYYDHADALGEGRRVRLFHYYQGVFTRHTLATDTAATGTLLAQVLDHIIGNRSDGIRTLAGTVWRFGWFPAAAITLLESTIYPKLGSLAGV